MEWISVKDRLPDPIKSASRFDERKTYLIALYDANGYFNGYRMAYYWGSTGWSTIDGARGFDSSVTHWMPLPDRPYSK